MAGCLAISKVRPQPHRFDISVHIRELANESRQILWRQAVARQARVDFDLNARTLALCMCDFRDFVKRPQA